MCFRRPTCAYWKTPTASSLGANFQLGFILWPTTCAWTNCAAKTRAFQPSKWPSRQFAIPQAHLLKREDEETAHQLLAALPPHLRAVVVLRVLHDYSQEETAKIVGVPVGTIKSRLHHALKQLRQMAPNP